MPGRFFFGILLTRCTMYPRRYIPKFLLVIFLSLFNSMQVGAITVPEGYQLVRDCGEDWLVFDPKYQNYVPYIAALHESEQAVSLALDLVKERHFTLLLKTNHEAYLFIDGALQSIVAPAEWYYISCDSLLSKYGEKELLLTLFGQRGVEGLSAALIAPINTMASDSLSRISPSVISLKIKADDSFTNFAVIAWILMLLIAAVFFLITPSIAYRITSLLTFFSRDFRTELYHHHRAYDPLIVIWVFVLALIVAFFSMAIDRYIEPLLPPAYAITERDSVGQLLGNFSKISFISFLLLYGKYFVISIMSRILNLVEISHIHFIKALQSSLLFYGLLSVGMLLLILQFPGSIPLMKTHLIVSVVAYYSLRFVTLYILLNQSSRILNLYLISYLCVVELIPLIVGIKFIS